MNEDYVKLGVVVRVTTGNSVSEVMYVAAR